LYDLPRIRADLARHTSGEADCADDLFKFAQLERWLTRVAPAPVRARPPLSFAGGMSAVG
jgi:hypothetical protein